MCGCWLSFTHPTIDTYYIYIIYMYIYICIYMYIYICIYIYICHVYEMNSN